MVAHEGDRLRRGGLRLRQPGSHDLLPEGGVRSAEGDGRPDVQPASGHHARVAVDERQGPARPQLAAQCVSAAMQQVQKRVQIRAQELFFCQI